MILRQLVEPLYERYLKMQYHHIPNHIAIIQDGNRRYAKRLGIDTAKGHRAGADKTEEMLDWAHELGIKHITLYTFSTENFSRQLREAVNNAENATKGNCGFCLNIALAYGGRNEIVLAAREILSAVAKNEVSPEMINVHMVEQHLHDKKGIPPVDLIIRTGNEYRTSNFLPWLANGHESAVYFCAPYWPLFRKIDLLRAIRIYDQRVCAKRT
ncbi:MAG: undecaprenyl diphosphate synthase family protein [Methanoregula sp.]|nr:undecaprenyl diphosphate synthase family protein [Methanoregula sp.]